MHELSNLSLWHATMSAEEWGPGRPALGSDLQVDVAIVGAGYTGMWTAYYLLQRDPSLRVALLEAQVVGFGASGRNGGWCSALLPMGLDAVAAQSSRSQAVRLQTVMHETVAEVGRVVQAEGIDCHFAHGGYLSLARSDIQMQRERAHVQHLQSYGFTDDDYRTLSKEEALQRCAASNVVGGAFTPHCAAIHPARLARGLARTIERMGATIYEHTPVVEISPRTVRTHLGTVKADVVVRATEAFTPSLAGTQAAGGADLLADDRHRAAARRVLAGDRAGPTRDLQRRPPHDRLRAAHGRQPVRVRRARRLVSLGQRHQAVLRPRLTRARSHPRHVARALPGHRRGGHHSSLGRPGGRRSRLVVPRRLRSQQRSCVGGRGFFQVSDGVGTTNLSGRTLADLITNTPSELATLPWVGHRSRKWEPEPLRFLGINTMAYLPIGADRHEERHGTASKWREAIMNRLLGH